MWLTEAADSETGSAGAGGCPASKQTMICLDDKKRIWLDQYRIIEGIKLTVVQFRTCSVYVYSFSG